MFWFQPLILILITASLSSKNKHDCWNLVRLVEHTQWIPGYVLMPARETRRSDMSITTFHKVNAGNLSILGPA